MQSINEFVAIFYNNRSQNTENYNKKANSLQFLNRFDDSQTVPRQYQSNHHVNGSLVNMKRSIKKFIESKPSSKSSYSEQDLFNTKTGKPLFWNSLRLTSTKKYKYSGKNLTGCLIVMMKTCAGRDLEWNQQIMTHMHGIRTYLT